MLIADYEPNASVSDLARSTKITLLVGISGAGKDTIKRELLTQPDFHDIVSHTTRLPRKNNGVMEMPDVDYHFIDDAIAEGMLERHEFIEAKFVHGIVYGTSTYELQRAHDDDKIAITDVDVQGVDEFKQLSPEVIAIFIIPPSYDVWRERLAQRYESAEAFAAEWDKRRHSAIMELEHALKVPYYHFVVNDDLDRAVRVVNEIAHRGDAFNRHDDEVRLRARDLLSAISAAD